MKQTIKSALTSSFPQLVPIAKDLRGVFRAQYTRLTSDKPAFTCPICEYSGPFLAHESAEIPILHTQCPRCGLYERHRLQFLVFNELAKRTDFSQQSIIHFAPEPHFEKLFAKAFKEHHTADIAAPRVDFRVDIRALPFENARYDVVFASHVLEHVDKDAVAISEIVRILKPGGIAILPVPIVSPHTIEYQAPNDHEFGHVRAVGVDYFDRYRKAFPRVEVFSSTDFDARYQLYTYEDRGMFPTPESPLRVSMPGEKHADYVPVCYK